MPLAENSADYVHGIQRLWRISGGTVQVYRNDRLGSAERLAGLAGATIGSVRYGEWGAPSIISPGLNPSCTGHEHDPALGIHFAKARFYDPLNSRMLSEDPVRGRMLELPGGQRAPMLSSLNLYAYCGGNPLAFVDPTGLDAIWINSSNWPGTLGSGHSSLLIENANGVWGYFYFAINAVTFAPVAPEAMSSLESFNEWTQYMAGKENKEYPPYDSSVYIKGDFTSAYSEAARLKDDNEFKEWITVQEKLLGIIAKNPFVDMFTNTADNKEYHLLFNNCATASWNLLKMGFLHDESRTGVGDFMDSFSMSPSFVPNNATQQVSFMFANSLFTKDGLNDSIRESMEAYESQTRRDPILQSKPGWSDLRRKWSKLLADKETKPYNAGEFTGKKQ
jgi:RHS repeat-associated protein